MPRLANQETLERPILARAAAQRVGLEAASTFVVNIRGFAGRHSIEHVS
jgi:hypothetical protein